MSEFRQITVQLPILNESRPFMVECEPRRFGVPPRRHNKKDRYVQTATALDSRRNFVEQMILNVNARSGVVGLAIEGTKFTWVR